MRRSGSVCCTGVSRQKVEPDSTSGHGQVLAKVVTTSVNDRRWPQWNPIENEWKMVRFGLAAGSDLESDIFPHSSRYFWRFFFRANLTATGQHQAENSIVVAQLWQCSHWLKRSTSQTCRKTKQQHSDLCSFVLEIIIIIILLWKSLWHLFTKLFTALIYSWRLFSVPNTGQFCTPRVGWQPCYWLLSANDANDNNRRVRLAFVYLKRDVISSSEVRPPKKMEHIFFSLTHWKYFHSSRL